MKESARPMNEPTRDDGSDIGPEVAVDGAPRTDSNAGSTSDNDDMQSRLVEAEDRWKRSAAEFQNYRRRAEQERQGLLRAANAGLIVELLPVLDDLERALANAPADDAETEWVKGTRLVERKFRQILERQGVTPIDAVGATFDPKLHEAIGGSGDTVTEEFQRGYTLHDRVLRPSMVMVGPAAEPAAQA